MGRVSIVKNTHCDDCHEHLILLGSILQGMTPRKTDLNFSATPRTLQITNGAMQPTIKSHYFYALRVILSYHPFLLIR